MKHGHHLKGKSVKKADEKFGAYRPRMNAIANKSMIDNMESEKEESIQNKRD